MPNFVAPLILLLAGSWLVYGKKTLWRLEEYKLTMQKWNWETAEEFVDLRNAVRKGLIDQADATYIQNQRWPGGRENPMPGITQEHAQNMVDAAVTHKQISKALATN
jgi:hypothetical protein